MEMFYLARPDLRLLWRCLILGPSYRVMHSIVGLLKTFGAKGRVRVTVSISLIGLG